MLNPGNSGFKEIRNSRYVDKSGLIGLINGTIGTVQKLTCVSRPRRFGKSFAAKMLCAYYDKTCDSAALFDDLEIAVNEELNSTYKQHLNKYDVIYLDMTYVKPFSDGFQKVIPYISEKITEELLAAYPALKVSNELPATLIHATELTGNKFIMIIDEWDAPIRRVRESEQLIDDTVHGNAEAVARQIEKIHEEESPLYYNNEQALRSVIKRAYFSYADEFVKFEELPAGNGYADIVYLPKKDSPLPALVIELKWNKSARGAIDQIKNRRYPAAIKGYGGDILLVGINYNKGTSDRNHECVIEKYTEVEAL